MPAQLFIVGRFTVPGDSDDMFMPGEDGYEARNVRTVEHSDIVPLRPGDDVRDIVANTLIELRTRHQVDGGEPVTITPLHIPAAEPVRVEDLTEVIASLDIVNGRLARNIDREERSALQRARSNLHHQLSAFADIPE